MYWYVYFILEYSVLFKCEKDIELLRTSEKKVKALNDYSDSVQSET